MLDNRKILGSFLSVFFPPFLLIFFLLGFFLLEDLKKERTDIWEEERVKVEKLSDIANHVVLHVVLDLYFLSGNPALHQVLESEDKNFYGDFSEKMISFCRDSGQYDQVRFLDRNGVEKFRVNHNGGSPVFVPREELQDKSSRYYVHEILKISPGDFFMSPLDLNMEGGSVELPLKPVIRFGMPVYGLGGELAGLFILNYKGEKLIAEMSRFMEGGAGEYELLNRDGYWLSSPRPEETWGFMLQHRKKFTVSETRPRVWDKVKENDSGAFMVDQGLISFMTVYPRYIGHSQSCGLLGGGHGSSENEPVWRLLCLLPQTEINSRLMKNISPWILMFVVAVTILALRSWRMARSAVLQKMTELKLRDSREAALDANRAKSAFLANMSHEIRTPMNAVIGFTDILMDTGLSRDQRELVVSIKRSGKALLGLINDILDFSKIEAGELVFEEIDFDPELVAYDVCELIRPRIEKKPIELICRIGEEVPALVRGDPLRFRQVLTNLMGNAPKFTQSGEIILEVKVGKVLEGKIMIHVRVSDTGIGIPEDKKEVIFDVFQQADGSTTRKYGGTGLGLSIARKIARIMGGDLWVGNPGTPSSGDEDSSPRGAVLHYTAWFGVSEVKRPGDLQVVGLAGKRVLIVDDNHTNQDILACFLESVGMAVKALDSPYKVIPALEDAVNEDQPFHAVVSDIQMPGMDGYEVAAKIRAGDASYSAVPLLALSSLMASEARRCEIAGYNGFLSKPIQRKKLFLMLERVLGIGDSHITDRRKESKILTQYSIREDRKQSVCILLAEDNEDNRKLAGVLLRKAGYEMVSAKNGMEAVEKYRASPHRYNMIFMDVQMPEMDGLTATREIRKWEAETGGVRKIPIVAMTAHAMQGDRERCIEAGMDDYVTKPIKRPVLYTTLETWVFGDREEPRALESKGSTAHNIN